MVAVRGLVVALVLVALVVGLSRVARGGRRRALLRRPAPTWGGLFGDSLRIVAGLALIAGLVVLLAVGGNLAPETPAARGFVALGAAPRPPGGGPAGHGPPAVGEVVHSEDKRRWIERAASLYMRRCPDVQIRLIARGDIEAAGAILRGESAPTVWAPIDELSLQYLDDRWRERSSDLLFEREQARPLVASPLVLLVWEDKLRALKTLRAAAGEREGFWPDALCAAIPRVPELDGRPQRGMLPGSWLDWYQSRFPPPPPAPAPPSSPRRARAVAPVAATPVEPGPLDVDMLRSWGRVRIASPAPTHDIAGLSTLFLMAHQYTSVGGLGGDVAAPGRRRGDLPRGARARPGGLDAPRESTRLMSDFVSGGAQDLDAIVTYEHLVFDVLPQFAAPETVEPRVYYPQPTLLARHPAVLLWPADPERATELAAAGRWLEFLLSEEVQRSAVGFGLRPVALDASLDELDLTGNPFIATRRFGVELEPELREVPRIGGISVPDLGKVWGEAAGRLCGSARGRPGWFLPRQ